ncbi:uncharacterized membrane protein [Parvularcula bermudensis HTCC2503]|uniref:Probable lipid II flippase MurJ n=1 Tax=Parvularcula bermudensis (strain ATCC BAA-594 / HTCC2503 / KCTC 12087) TaxID=314260 RepID=E0THL9_PARBH|nr:murein biosynthesis integral membrane protein MurJ [Parvularcula bermudensis]ADM09315.1 uncharacterized membrane protein [Parvularcula bermudensis HTCC2503]
MARSILKSLATVSGLTMASRVLGFARQMLLAAVIGAGNPVADAFWVAFRLPNMFRRLLAEGAFHAAFVPLFQGKEVKEGHEAARRFAEDILAWQIIILTGLTAAVMIFTPIFVGVIATGFLDDPERLNLTVLYTRIMFPYLACMSLVGIYAGMLNALQRFAAAAAAPLLLNLALIGGILLYADQPVAVTGQAAAWAVLVGGLLQLAALIFAAQRSSLLLRLRLPRFNKHVRRLVVLGAPGFIGAGALQINGIVGTNVASRQDGANSWLAFADQLYQLPLSMIGIALGIVLMPTISRAVKADDQKGAMRSLNRGMEIALFLSLPAAAALIVIPDLICAALFQDLAGLATRAIGAGGSAFGDTDVDRTGVALMIFGWGLPAFVLQKIFAAAFFAREDTRTPMTFALVAIAINAALSISLFPVIGFLSVPLGTICASWTEVSLLASRLRHRGYLKPNKHFVSTLIKILVAVGALAATLLAAEAVRADLVALLFGQLWLYLALLVATAMLAYGGIAIVIGAVKPADWIGSRRSGTK